VFLELSLDSIVKRISFLTQNFKNGFFRPVDNFKQAIKQKEWYNAFLKFKQSKHQFKAK
jgi:hypothetical protein